MSAWLPRAAVGAGVIGLALAITFAPGCGDKNCAPNAPCPTPTPGGSTGVCANLTGTRNMFWNDTCGGSGTGVISISQSSCSFQANAAGLGTFAGTVSGNNLSYTLTFTSPCAGTATGTATVAGTAISGMYTGSQTGPSPCCGPMTGYLTFSYAPTAIPTTATPTPVPII